MIFRKTATYWLLFALTSAFSCGGPVQPENSNAQWDAFRDKFIDGYFQHHPAVAVFQGRHEFDGKLPDWSREGIAATVAYLHQSRDEARAFSAESLNESQRFERDYLLAMVDGELFTYESARAPFKNPFFYMHWALDNLDPATYVSRDYAPLADRMRAFTKYAGAIPLAAEQIRANLETPLPKAFIRIAHTNFGGLAGFLADDVPGVFKDVKDAALQKEFSDANTAAVKALKELDAWFTSQEAAATDDFALGADRFLEMVRRAEGLDITIDRLRTVAEEDLERNRTAVEEACAKLAPGVPIAECIAKVTNQKPTGDVVEAARKQLVDLRAFLEDHPLLTIPGTEQAEVKEAPPYQRWNFAYIDIPGPYEKQLPSVYYIAPPDPAWSAKEQHDYLPGVADLLFTSVHEVWPGHFLHYMHARRSKSKFGQVFQSYAFTEGWAHYAEEMMWDAGLGGGDPAIHLGQLLNALLRDARFVSAVGLHTGGMTLEESERVFTERAFQDAGTARQQALRGTFDPGYLNYTLGKLMIRKLREDWTATRGGREAWREFHDKLLSFGGPPVPLVRKAMLGAASGPAL